MWVWALGVIGAILIVELPFLGIFALMDEDEKKDKERQEKKRDEKELAE